MFKLECVKTVGKNGNAYYNFYLVRDDGVRVQITAKWANEFLLLYDLADKKY